MSEQVEDQKDTQPEVRARNSVPKEYFRRRLLYPQILQPRSPLLPKEKALLELVRIASATDPASRRIQTEQCWKARLFNAVIRD